MELSVQHHFLGLKVKSPIILDNSPTCWKNITRIYIGYEFLLSYIFLRIYHHISIPMGVPLGNLSVKLSYIILCVWGSFSGMGLGQSSSVYKDATAMVQGDALPRVKAMEGDARRWLSVSMYGPNVSPNYGMAGPAWEHILPLPLHNCVTSEKTLSLSMSQYLHWYNRNLIARVNVNW